MPVIRISDPIFQRLQSIAVPLVDTPAMVIEKLLNFYEAAPTPQKQIQISPRIQRPFIKVSDSDVEFLAQSGDKAALQEAQLRLSLADKLKDSSKAPEQSHAAKSAHLLDEIEDREVVPPLFNPSSAPPDLTHTHVVAASFGGKPAENWNDLHHLAHRVAFASLGTFDDLKSISKSNISRGHVRFFGNRYLKDLDISIQNVNANDAWSRTLHMAQKLRVPLRVEVEWPAHRGATRTGRRRTLAWSPEIHSKGGLTRHAADSTGDDARRG